MSHLFSAYHLGPVQTSNRLVIAPMCQYSAVNGAATDWHLMHIANLAMSGAGTVILEATAVLPEGRISTGCLGLWDDHTQQALARSLELARKQSDAKLLIQLAHAGRKASCAIPWGGGKQLDLHAGGWPTVSASALAFQTHERSPLALDTEGLARVRQGFAESAKRAAAIGLDGIEIHAAHGYLLHQFLSPLSNQRTDQYGGSLENRIRLVLEVFEAVRHATPAHMTVGIRISATDWVEGGWSLPDSIVISQAMKTKGCDFIDVSSGALSPAQKIPLGPGYQVHFADAIRRETQLATMAVGLITEPKQAEQILVTGQADMIAIARASMYDPRWGWHAAAALGDRIKAAPQYWRAAPDSAAALFIKEL